MTPPAKSGTDALGFYFGAANNRWIRVAHEQDRDAALSVTVARFHARNRVTRPTAIAPGKGITAGAMCFKHYKMPWDMDL
jgi:hypothetical protein